MQYQSSCFGTTGLEAGREKAIATIDDKADAFADADVVIFAISLPLVRRAGRWTWHRPV
jgi:hypothetical protein